MKANAVPSPSSTSSTTSHTAWPHEFRDAHGNARRRKWVEMFAGFGWVLALFVILAPVSSVTAQTEDDLNREARDIFETVLSPYCPGRTISNCPSPQAEELRTAIKQQLADGEASEDIKEELYAVFGDELRTIPRARGFGLLAWIVPGLAFLMGGWLILTWMGRTRPDGHVPPAPTSMDLDAATQARLDAEMKELESMT